MKNKILIAIPPTLFLILSLTFLFLRIPALASMIDTNIISSTEVLCFLGVGNALWVIYLILLHKKVRLYIKPTTGEDFGYVNGVSNKERHGNKKLIILAYWIGIAMALVLVYEMFFGYIAHDIEQSFPYTIMGLSVGLMAYLVNKIDLLNDMR